MGWDDPLEKGVESHSSILALKIPWTGEPGSLQSKGISKKSDIREHTFIYTTFSLSIHPWMDS